MKPMDRKYKKEDALLRDHKESTFEKNQANRLARRNLIANKVKDLDKEVKSWLKIRPLLTYCVKKLSL